MVVIDIRQVLSPSRQYWEARIQSFSPPDMVSTGLSPRLSQPRQFCGEGDRVLEGAAGEGFSGVGIDEAIV